MAILKVRKENGTLVELPDPYDMETGVQDVDGHTAGRNQSGLMFRDRVAVKMKFSCKWHNIDEDKVSTILNAITDQFFTLIVFDPLSKQNKEYTVYVGDRTMGAYWFHNGKWLFSNLNANFIER